MARVRARVHGRGAGLEAKIGLVREEQLAKGRVECGAQPHVRFDLVRVRRYTRGRAGVRVEVTVEVGAELRVRATPNPR